MSTEGTFITWLLGFPLHKAEYWPGMGFSVAVEQDQGGGALPSPLGWLLKHLPLPDAHSLWDNVFTSIPWAHFPFQLRSHPNVGIYLWQLKSSPCKHNLPSSGQAGTSPECLSSQVCRVQSTEMPRRELEPHQSHQQATKGPFRGASDALLRAEVPGAHIILP